MSDETKAPEALVEELRQAGWDAVDGAKVIIEGGAFGIAYDALPTFVRTVLAHLARQGVDGLPNEDALADLLWKRITSRANERFKYRFPDRVTASQSTDPMVREDAGDMLDDARTILALFTPLLAARDAALVEARAERDEAREWVRRLTRDTRVLTCAFCGEAYPPGTPESNHGALTAHVRVCAKHPMRETEAEVSRLQQAIAEASSALEDALEEPATVGETLAVQRAIDALAARSRASAEPGPDQDIAATVQEHAAGPVPPAPDELEYVRNLPINSFGTCTRCGYHGPGPGHECKVKQ